jgi:hypothetical protein
VNDGTCSFPNNFFGCENAARGYTGGVKFIKEDYDIECEVSGAHWGVSHGHWQPEIHCP